MIENPEKVHHYSQSHTANFDHNRNLDIISPRRAVVAAVGVLLGDVKQNQLQGLLDMGGVHRVPHRVIAQQTVIIRRGVSEKNTDYRMGVFHAGFEPLKIRRGQGPAAGVPHVQTDKMASKCDVFREIKDWWAFRRENGNVFSTGIHWNEGKKRAADDIQLIKQSSRGWFDRALG